MHRSLPEGLGGTPRRLQDETRLGEETMGLRVTLFAVEGLSLDTVLQRTGWEPTGRTDDGLNVGVFAAELSTGFTVLAGDGRHHSGSLPWEVAIDLSRDRRLYYFVVDDASMRAGLICIEDGDITWSVNYDGSGGPSENSIDGSPPPSVAALVAAAPSEDGYEVAPDLLKYLVGIRHDESPSLVGSRPYVHLRAVP